MSVHESALGVCPRCDSQIPAQGLLIEYETVDGSAMYADCPNCRDVVHPA